jgi:hypothetical protein
MIGAYPGVGRANWRPDLLLYRAWLAERRK